MYRAGWSYKDPNQARILQLTMSKEGFLTLLREAASSSGSDVADTKGALVRFQWDPERNIKLGRLPYRSLQLGIAGTMRDKWINEWIIRIDDITEDVRRWKGYMDEDGDEGVKKAQDEIDTRGSEDVFEVDEELELSLRMRLTDDTTVDTSAH